MSLKEMFQDTKHQLSIKIATPILEIPFHSTLINLPKDEFEQQRYDRMWVINLGNINFMTQKKIKDSSYSLDMYERYTLNIAQVNIQVRITWLINYSIIGLVRNFIISRYLKKLSYLLILVSRIRLKQLFLSVTINNQIKQMKLKKLLKH